MDGGEPALAAPKPLIMAATKGLDLIAMAGTDVSDAYLSERIAPGSETGSNGPRLERQSQPTHSNRQV